MAFSPARNGVEKDMAQRRSPLPQSTSINGAANTLRLNTSAASPSSSQPSSPRTLTHRTSSPSGTPSLPNARLPPPRSPLHRSPSSMSTSDETRSSTPTLLRKASMNSLHGVSSRRASPGPQPRAPSRSSPSRSSPSRTSMSRRSSSSSFLNASTMVGKSPLSEFESSVEAPPQHTAQSIAESHFQKELELHGRDDAAPTDTVVILHDSCYGHRYSRPRTSKASLSSIVERPERIHASILGVSIAYVRLGDRHADGQYPLKPKKDTPDDPMPTPFRILKTARRLSVSSQAVTNVHGIKWMEELKIMCDGAESKLAMNGKELARPELNRGTDEVVEKFHEGDLYLCSESLNAMEGAMGAVCEGVDAVFEGSATGKGPHRTFVAIRPPGHHCSASYPSGFCWVNNVHVGISHASLTHGLTHAAIIDFDLHHGDGSQAIAWEHNRRATNLTKNALPWKKTSIGYFSLHDINSYPCEQGDEEKVKMASLCIENAHGQSVWNVHLQPWKSEAEFWELYETKYSILLEKTRNYLRNQTERLRSVPNGPKPKGAIFLSAGFDASEWESDGMQRHKVNVPTEFYARLTRDVVKIAAEEGSAVDGRVISVLEGGYSDRALCTGVFSHLSGLAGGDPIAIRKEFKIQGLGYEMGNKIGTFDGLKKEPEPVATGTLPYDPEWWSLSHLEFLDNTISPGPVVEVRKPREGVAPTYSSPTQSFIAKVASPSARRTISNMSNPTHGSPRQIVRGPTPPPPEVNWAVASHQLSKLLIPTDRQTMSCTPEDLSAPATRVRRDRQSILTPPTSTSGSEQPEPVVARMALRTRKPVKTEAIEKSEPKEAATRQNRRKTLAVTAIVGNDNPPSMSTTSVPTPEPGFAVKQSNRRLSVASSSGSMISEAPSIYGRNRVPSSGLQSTSTRPATSQSIRPDSSMSSRGPSVPPAAVKKARAPPHPRAEPQKAPRARRKSPLNNLAIPSKTHASVIPASESTSSVLPSIETTQSGDAEMDALTANMKQTTLNTNAKKAPIPTQRKTEVTKIRLITKEQREARERAKLAAQPTATISSQQALPEVVQKAPVELHAAISQDSVNLPSELPSLAALSITEDQFSADILAPINSVPYLPNPVQEASPDPLTSSSPPVARSTQSPLADNFIPYQPDGPPASMSVQQEPIRWLPPNTSTPKGTELPVFTATSAIPFGANPALGQQMLHKPATKEIESEKNSIWDVPGTPKH